MKYYWLITVPFVIIFGEILPGIISRNPAFFQHWLAISIYYCIITFIFAILFKKMKSWLVAVVLFLYGGFMEVFLFKGIRIFVVAGLFYIFLFWFPHYILRWSLKKQISK
ncbi:MAG: hypothetical protein PHT41_05835 [Candidatus Omnitrophica bacterium]|nr:hypothetical protein [Candidatus Omnitrophota bacterium]MDD5238227.1 hypothetical protein [Candidatus Omnitrophota bacterium]